MLIPLPKELGLLLSKYGKKHYGRMFTVDVLLFVMAKSKHLPEKMRQDKAMLFAYRMGRKDYAWKNALGKKNYSTYVMDAADEYFKQEKLDKQ